MEKIILVGAGGHAGSVIDSIERAGQFQIAGLVDREISSDRSGQYRIIGNDDDLPRIYRDGIRYAFVTVGYMGKENIRGKLYKLVKRAGFQVPIVIDPSAIVAEDCFIGEGTFVGKGAIINANAKIGKMCIINTAAVIEHDCMVDDYSHVAVGAVLCGGVRVGKTAFIGANSTVIQERNIGDGCFIGAGTVITKNLEPGQMQYGNIRRQDKLFSKS